jgi:hypothetical protein
MRQDFEGWGVRARPAIFGLALFIACLFASVTVAGVWYDRHYAAQTRPEPARFPAPELETIDTASTDARHSPVPTPPTGIEQAKAETVARGNALWGDR